MKVFAILDINECSWKFSHILDINECSQTSGICSNGVCENMMGTYQCMCDDGYQQQAHKGHCEGKK